LRKKDQRDKVIQTAQQPNLLTPSPSTLSFLPVLSWVLNDFIDETVEK